MIDANESSLLAVAEVKLAYLKGSVLIGVSSLTVERVIAGAVGSMSGNMAGLATLALSDWGKTEIAIGLRKDMVKLGEEIDLWATRDRQRAINGDRKLFGGFYTWDDWAFRGNSLIAAINDDTKLGWDSMPYNNYIATIKGIASDAVDAAEAGAEAVKDTLGWLPWIFGGLAVVVGGIVVYEVARSARTVSDEVRLTAQTAGGAARRRFSGARR